MSARIPDGPTLPDWCIVGAIAYEENSRGPVTRRTVKKITATQVVTTSGSNIEDRYRRTNLTNIKDGDWNHRKLIGPDDPAVARALRKRRIDDTSYEVVKAGEAIRNSPDPVDVARRAVALLADFIEKETQR